MMAIPSHSARRLLVACLLTVSVAACSTSGQNASGDLGGPATAVPESSTTAGAGDPLPTATTEAAPIPQDVSLADLEAILPTAREVGGSYGIEDSDEDDDDDGSDPASDAAWENACPEAIELFGETADDSDDAQESAEVSMEDADNHIFEVELELTPDPSFDAESVGELIDVINACDTLEYTDDEGWDLTMDLGVERADEYGDAGILMLMDITLDRPELDAPLEIGYAIRTFLVGSVTVSVSGSDGLDDRTYATIPRDDALIEEYAAEMETRVRDLLEG